MVKFVVDDILFPDCGIEKLLVYVIACMFNRAGFAVCVKL